MVFSLLSRLTLEILSQMYTNNTTPQEDRSVEETIHLTIQFSCKLSTWLQSVPMDFRPTSASKRSSSLYSRRLYVDITFRYYGVSVLTHRAIVSSFLNFQSDSADNPTLSVLNDVGLFVLKKALKTCSECISFADSVIEEVHDEGIIYGAWFNLTYYSMYHSSNEGPPCTKLTK